MSNIRANCTNLLDKGAERKIGKSVDFRVSTLFLSLGFATN